MARPSPLPHRVAAVQAAILTEHEPLVTLTHLLQLCRDEHPVLWEAVNDPQCRARAALLVDDVRGVLPAARAVSRLDRPMRRAISNALTAAAEIPAVVVARALAELLDERCSASFEASFRSRSPYQPGVGDPIPLNSPDLRQVTALPATSPPWRLANRLDETRHIRLAGEWATQFQVIFDYSHADALTGIIGPDTVIATCHPNRDLDDFDFPRDAAGRTFGIRPADEPRQHRVLNRLIGRAVTAGASIIVLPELSVTQALATRLQDWTRRPDGPRLLVAGSFHHENVGAAVGDTASLQPRRRNTAIAYLRGSQPPLTQDKYSPADRPVHEDIRPSGWPRLHIYVSGDGWHLAIAICRDLLNPHAVHAMTEAGVNLALVPAMSETLIAFGAPVAQLVGAGQAFVAVANNPADFSDTAALVARRPARALFGHPGFGQQTRLVHPSDGEPGLALLSVGTGQLQWLGTDVVATIPPAGAEPEPPPWAAALRRQCGPDRIGQDRPAGPATLLPAAVLVLLTDTPLGPQALLTTRSPDLAHYPGQVVFPGGAADPGDDGPIATALREAAEETGLDPTSVQILGTLPALALPDSGFLLTPVLAWSHRPVFTGSPNLSEVTAVTSIPVGPRASPDTFARLQQEPDVATVAAAVSPLGAATATVIDTVTGMLTRGATPPATSPGRALDRARSWPA